MNIYNAASMKKVFLALILALAILNWPVDIYAQETCVSVYGGGVICGTSTEHKPVNTALGDINPALVGGIFLIISGGLNKLSKKLKSSIE